MSLTDKVRSQYAPCLPLCLREHRGHLECLVSQECSLHTLRPRSNLWDLARPLGLECPPGLRQYMASTVGLVCSAPLVWDLECLHVFLYVGWFAVAFEISQLLVVFWLHQEQEEFMAGKPDCATLVDGSLASKSRPGEDGRKPDEPLVEPVRCFVHAEKLFKDMYIRRGSKAR